MSVWVFSDVLPQSKNRPGASVRVNGMRYIVSFVSQHSLLLLYIYYTYKHTLEKPSPADPPVGPAVGPPADPPVGPPLDLLVQPFDLNQAVISALTSTQILELYF